MNFKCSRDFGSGEHKNFGHQGFTSEQIITLFYLKIEIKEYVKHRSLCGMSTNSFVF